MSSSSENSPDVAVAQTFKVLVLGDSGVGKTSLIRYYKKGIPSLNMISTVGIDFSDFIISVRGVRVKLRVWDTAGQERFHTLTKQFVRGAQGILLVYDITSYRSFSMLTKWLRMLAEEGLDNIDMVLIGNKSDLEGQRAVPAEIVKQFASEKGCQHVNTSTISGTNVKKCFYKMAESLVHTYNIFLPGFEADSPFEGNDDLRSYSNSSASRQSYEENKQSIVLSKQVLMETDEHLKKKKGCSCKNS